MERRSFLVTMSALAGGMALGQAPFALANQSEFLASLVETNNPFAYWARIRDQFVFPRDYTYLNTGGIGAVPNLVLEAVKQEMDALEVHPSPSLNMQEWNAIKENTKDLLSPQCCTDELALVSTATEGINIIINGLPLQAGDEVIVSTHEHPAVCVPVLNRMRRDGIVIRTFDPDRERALGNVERIEALITDRTRLIFISHITCTTGQRFPLREIGELARSHDILFAVDGAQAAGSMPMNIVTDQVDFYTFSGHKWTLGPKRTGVLYVRLDRLDVLRPITVGAYSDAGHNIIEQTLEFQPTAQRFEYGTQNESLFRGMKVGMDFVKTIGLDTIRNHNKRLAEQFVERITPMNGVEIISPAEEEYRTSMISFRVDGMNNRDITSQLSAEGIRVRVVDEVGLNAIRVSFHVYNNEDDVDRIVGVLNTIL